MTFDLDLWVKATQNGAQYPLHYVAYALVKIEFAMFNGLKGDVF